VSSIGMAESSSHHPVPHSAKGLLDTFELYNATEPAGVGVQKPHQEPQGTVHGHGAGLAACRGLLLVVPLGGGAGSSCVRHQRSGYEQACTQPIGTLSSSPSCAQVPLLPLSPGQRKNGKPAKPKQAAILGNPSLQELVISNLTGPQTASGPIL
jgi:hypothetical protein